MFLYSLLKFAASAVLKIIPAVIAIAHVLSLSIKSLSVSFNLLEISLGRFKYDSATLPMSGSLDLHLFLLLSHLFLLRFQFFLKNIIQCG